MVGDNPESDMAGCVNMNAAIAATATTAGAGETTTKQWIEASKAPGEADGGAVSVTKWLESQAQGGPAESPPWRGVLVRTGVYTEGGDTGQAAAVVDDVKEAVQWIVDVDRFVA